jgi:hypothetical protein
VCVVEKEGELQTLWYNLGRESSRAVQLTMGDVTAS